MKLLGHDPEGFDEEDEDFDEVEDRDEAIAAPHGNHTDSEFKNFSADEITSLNRCLALLRRVATEIQNWMLWCVIC